MEAQQVINKILSEAQCEADRIKSEAQEKLSAQKGRFENELDEYEKQTDELAKKAGEDKKAYMLAAARMELAKEYLAEKRRILDEVFQKARDKLLNLSDEQYKELMTRLMTDAVRTGDEEVIIGEQEGLIDNEFIKQVNRRLGPDYHRNLKLSGQKQDITAGFILGRGRIKTNVSIDVLLNQVREQLDIELAKQLFKS